MKIKHEDILIPAENPFENCQLGRKKYAEALTGIIDTYADGFVLSLNNEWGTGKTTFIKMWQQLLTNSQYNTLYFNAWENDFDSNPLIAIMSELKTLTKDNDDVFKSLIQKGAILTQNLLPILVKALADKYINTEIIKDSIDEITKSATEILKNEVDEYSKKKKGLIEFRNELEKFIKKNNKKALVFFIDELDRCRPSYAVEVLEQVKHFFNVPGIVFVLSLDKVQLGNAIKGFYGSEYLNTNEYLRRFIDLEYNLPIPDTKLFCNYLYKYFSFDDFFLSEDRKTYQEFNEDRASFLKFSATLFTHNNLTLRQQEKIFGHARAVLNTFPSDNYVFPTLYLFLVYLKDLKNSLYKQIRQRELRTQELINEIDILFKEYSNDENYKMFIRTAALLLLFYNNYLEYEYRAKLTKYDNTTLKNILLIRSDLNENDVLLNFLSAFERNTFDSVKLDFLLNKIDLIESLSIL